MNDIKKINAKFLFSMLLLGINFIMVIFSLRSNPFSHILSGHDSSMFIYFGKGMQDGLVPYSDMFDHKGIVLFLIQQLGVILGFGHLTFGIWLVEIIFYGVAVFFLLKSLMFLTNNFLTSSAAIAVFTGAFIATFEGGNYSEPYALTFISIALYLFVKICLENPDNKLQLFFIGLTGGLTFFIRSNMIGLWLVFCMYLLIVGLLGKKKRVLIIQVFFIFLGGLAVCLLIFFYAVLVGNLKDMIYQTFILNLQYSSASTITNKLLAGKIFFEFASRIGIVPFIVLYLFYLINYKDKIEKDTFSIYLVLLIYLVVNFVTVIMSGRSYIHYFITMFPGIILITGISLAGISQSIRTDKKNILVICTLFLMSLSYSYVTIRELTVPVLTARPNETIDSDTVRAAAYVKEHTTKDDSIYVHNINANIYLLSDRYANSKFFVLPALDYREFLSLRAEFVESLKVNPPKYIILRKKLFSNQNNLTDAKLDKTICKVVNDDYTKVKEFECNEFEIFSQTQ